MSLIKKTYISFFLLGIFFLPFNSEVPEFLSFLGEYGSDSSPMFFLLGFLFLLISDLLLGKMKLPFLHPVYYTFLVFFVYIVISIFFNFINVSDYYFKQTTGWVRYIKQLISVIMAFFMFFYLFYNVCISLGVVKTFFVVRKTMLRSLIIVFVVGLTQFLIYSGANDLISVYDIFDYLPFTKPTLYFELTRVNATAFRPPDLGIYLICICGFMFSYVLTEKKWYKYLPLVIVIFLSIVSKSRTALVTVFLQVLCLVYLSYKNYSSFRRFFNKAVLFFILFLPIIVFLKGNVIYTAVNERIESLNFSDVKSDNAISNKSRFGIQYANYLVFKKHPITGAGWGQQSFESKDLYPKWATNNNYEFRAIYLNEKIKSFPPGYNLYLRLLAETGIVGSLLFLLFLSLIFYFTHKFLITKSEYKYIGITVFIVFFGTVLTWFQIDSFRLYVFWLALAMLICLKVIDKRKNDVIL